MKIDISFLRCLIDINSEVSKPGIFFLRSCSITSILKIDIGLFIFSFYLCQFWKVVLFRQCFDLLKLLEFIGIKMLIISIYYYLMSAGYILMYLLAILPGLLYHTNSFWLVILSIILRGALIEFVYFPITSVLLCLIHF